MVPPQQQQQQAQGDLCNKLNHNRATENARLTIERACEQCRNEQEAAGGLPAPVLHAPSAQGQHLLPIGVGCKALMPELRAVTWPPKFRPHLPEKYDGTIDTSEFLQIYTTAIFAAGGSTDVMANYFHVALTGASRSWLMNLPECLVSSWEMLSRMFVSNFAGTCSRPGSEADLHAIRQQPDEMLRAFVQHFCQVRNTIPQISPASVIVAF